MAHVEQVNQKRRGRRAAGEDTKAALVAAAREVFIEKGYDGATVRAIAAKAGVDAAMVNHWFGGKEGLFAQSVLQLPFDPAEILKRVLDGPAEEAGERIIRTFVTVWDATGGGTFSALIRSVTSQPEVAGALKSFLVNAIFKNVLAELGAEQHELRATLCATQMVGLGIVRYVVQFEPLASTDLETVVRTVAPNLQRYLTGDLD
ncbi:TetR family transcriptional regulator [Lentzea flaviverrucosa]|uniref:Transcriptional regulator, TetR family n=1 Tax=Lentzea flaviverrucosa TaxID=200379 RepID=A0A1H9UQC7_9PSEU|nr:TetR family transcriptional regulator [Lentzea flaviverrucosa]RDI27789.1 TetR family transcriptional regulator [Lentzea flaviverrucosa]SES11559.1 transcriptional regulator, TetR family [Lentzea flaviverrucosa]